MEKIDISAVFSQEDSDAVDFEIAFTAAIVTAVLSTPVDGIGYTILKGLVIFLSLLTLLRKMAVSNRHKQSVPPN